MAHELGHYLAAMYHRVDASLPYFMPSPFLGTFGAFIRVRSPIYSKRVLFDIGAAGPLAGFVFLLPALSVGLAFSKVIPNIAHQGMMQFGAPGLEWLMERLIFPGVRSADIYLHPVARAAWIGMFATALNLLPIGQLDGGHILYSFFPHRHKLVSKLLCIALLPHGMALDGVAGLGGGPAVAGPPASADLRRFRADARPPQAGLDCPGRLPACASPGRRSRPAGFDAMGRRPLK